MKRTIPFLLGATAILAVAASMARAQSAGTTGAGSGAVGVTGSGVTPGAPSVPGSGTSTASDTTTSGAAGSGFVLRDGILYNITNGRANRIDAATIPNGQMMTSDGRLVPIPAGVSGLGTQSSTFPTHGTSGTIIGGTRTTPGATGSAPNGPTGSTAGSANPSTSTGTTGGQSGASGATGTSTGR